MFDTMCHCNCRYLPLLLKVRPGTAEYPLSEVMKLLASPLCKPPVGAVIMEMVGNILDFHTSTSVEHMETDGSQVIPVGEIVQVDDSGKFFQFLLKP